MNRRKFIPEIIADSSNKGKHNYDLFEIIRVGSEFIEFEGYRGKLDREKTRTYLESHPNDISAYMIADDIENFGANLSGSALTIHIKNFSHWKKDGQKIGVYSKSLSQALVETDANANSKFLPENFCLYLELDGIEGPDSTIRGAFIGREGESLHITCISEQYDLMHTSYTILEDTDLEEILERSFSKFSKHQAEKGKQLYTALVNATVYYFYTDKEKVCLNSFSGSKNAIATQKKLYSQLPYFSFGQDFILPKSFREKHIDATIRSGHFRWQPYGPARSLVKHIYIEPTIVNYSKE